MIIHDLDVWIPLQHFFQLCTVQFSDKYTAHNLSFVHIVAVFVQAAHGIQMVVKGQNPGASGATGTDAGGAIRPRGGIPQPPGRNRNRSHERQCRDAVEDFRSTGHEDERPDPNGGAGH